MSVRIAPFQPTRRRFLAGAAALALPGWLMSCARAPVADLILLGGEIHTVDAADRRVEALAVIGNRIIATGTDAEIGKLAGPQTRRVGLAGRTVLPGINDSHLHLLGWGLSKPPFSIDVTYPTVKSIADVVAAVGRAAATRPPGEWIVGRGWDQPYLSEGRAPTAADLDAVAPDHPVALTEFSGHAVWANSLALKIAGIDRDTVPAPGGVIVRDGNGDPTGLLFEGPAFKMRATVPEASPAQKEAAISAAMQLQLARGITSATEPGLSPADLQLYHNVANAAAAPRRMRITGMLAAGASAATLQEGLRALPDLSATDPAWMRSESVKIMGDGIPTGNKTAWLNKPYEGGGNGSLLIDGESDAARVAELREMIRLIHAAGLQIGTHVTGDRSIDETVAAYEVVLQGAPRQDARHYLIHADLVSEATLARMAAANIGANFNPEIKYLIADSQVKSIGAARASYEWPYHSALGAGVNIASSSDAPVTEGNWLQGLATCMERRGKQTGNVSGPEQRITLDQAIRTYTAAGAWQDRAESFKGSLEAGKVADLVVLDERLSSAEPSRYAQISVAMTLVDGQAVHDIGF